MAISKRNMAKIRVLQHLVRSKNLYPGYVHRIYELLSQYPNVKTSNNELNINSSLRLFTNQTVRQALMNIKSNRKRVGPNLRNHKKKMVPVFHQIRMLA
jgi:hypothetical protein